MVPILSECTFERLMDFSESVNKLIFYACCETRREMIACIDFERVGQKITDLEQI